MSKNRKNPWPDPEREWWDNHKGKMIRVSEDLMGERHLEGKLVWVSLYEIGLELVGANGMPKVDMLRKGSIARKESLE